MDERDIDILVRMLLETDEIAARVNEFGINEAKWQSSRALRDLLLMPLIQIGELSTHLRDSGVTKEFPVVPWREIKGFRNVVVHGYGQIDIDIAWESATKGIAELREALLADDAVRAAYESELRMQFDPASPGINMSELIQSLPSVNESADEA